MKVSIVTSCYNRESTIRGAIESVLAQDYHDIEYVIVDGASKDDSVAVIEEAIKNLPENVIKGSEWPQVTLLDLYTRTICCMMSM